MIQERLQQIRAERGRSIGRSELKQHEEEAERKLSEMLELRRNERLHSHLSHVQNIKHRSQLETSFTRKIREQMQAEKQQGVHLREEQLKLFKKKIMYANVVRGLYTARK